MINLKLNELFKNKCLYKKNGIRVNSLGFVSILNIFFSVLFIIFNTYLNLYSIIKLKKLKNNDIYVNYFKHISTTSIILHYIKSTILSILEIIFFYNMAKMCRGFFGFLLLIIISIIIYTINNYIFSDFNKDLDLLFITKPPILP